MPMFSAGRLVKGVDFSIDAVSVCRHKLSKFITSGLLELQCADVCQLPFPAEMFTKVCSVNAIYFWADPKAAHSEIYRVLQECGKFVLRFSPRNEMRNRKFTQHGFKLYESDEVMELLKKVGFHNISVEYVRHRSDQLVSVTATKN